MPRNFNQGLTTSMKGAEIEGVRVTGLNVTVGQLCTISDQGNSGLVGSVTHTATGVYTFQLTVPFPARVITISPEVSAAAANSAILTARYQDGSYNATTGQFIINISNATPAAADGGAATELHVYFVFERYSTIKA
jgi:hypothetical protein